MCAGQKNKSPKLQTEAEELEAEEGMKGEKPVSTAERLHMSLAGLTVAIWMDVKDNTSRYLSLLRLLVTMSSACPLG